MKRSFRILTFLFLFCFSFVSALSSSLETKSDSFSKISIYPIYRLPDKDITVEWSTTSTAGISISYGDTLITEGSEGEYTIPAALLALMPESFEIKVKVNTKDGEEKKVKIETFLEPKTIKLSARQRGVSDQYTLKFDDKEWDSRLVIQEVELDYPKKYYCGNLDVDMQFREIDTKWEYYNETRESSGYLDWNSMYKSKRGFPVMACGSMWTFKFWNYPWHERCRDIRPYEFDPDIIFTIGAKEK